MRRTFLARAALAVVAGVLAAGALAVPAAAADDEATVAGTLTDTTGQPVVSSFVMVENPATGDAQYAYTDEAGAYAVAVSPGTYRVSFSRGSLTQWAYQKASPDEATTFAATAGETVRVDDRLLATGGLGGRITRADGTPLAWAQVNLHRNGDPFIVAYTDDDGRYLFDAVLPGNYRVSFQWDGIDQFVPGGNARAYTVVAGETTTVDDSALPPATLRGRLVDTEGKPQDSFTVDVVPEAESNTRRYGAVTDQNGEWFVNDVPAGRYRVSFTNPRQTRVQWAASVIDAGAGATVTVDETWLPDTTLVVKAVDSVTGAPVESFCVQVWIHSDEPVCAGPDGAPALVGLPAGSVDFTVETPETSYYTSRYGLSASLKANETTTVTVPLVRGGRVALTATDRASGRVVEAACFQLKAIGRPETFGSGCTDAQGRATTGQAVTPGTYEVFVRAPDDYGHQWVGRSGGTGDQRAAARVVVKAGATATAPKVLLDPAGAITGVVTGADGAPLNRVNVNFRAIAYYGSGETDGVFTDAAGRYTIGKLGPYAWPLLFSADGYPIQWSGNGGNRFTAVKVPAGTTYDMRLARTSTLRGAITPGAAEVRLLAHNAVTGDLVGVFHRHDEQKDVTSYEIPLAGGQQVKIEWNLYSGATATRWHAGATDISTATKINIPASGVKKLNLAY